MMINSDEVWKIIVGAAFNHRNESNPNATLDVLRKNCLADYDTVACLRGTLFCFLSAVTAILCAGRIISLHFNGHPNLYQYLVFYLALVQCLLGTVEWIVGWTLHIALAIIYIHILQILTVSYFYVKLASKVQLKGETFSKTTSAVWFMFLIYFTFLFVIGYSFASSIWFDCFANYWLFLSAGEILVIQLLLVAGLLIISRVNAISALESLKRSQKKGLLVLIFVFECSALINFTFQLALFFLANEEIGCSGVFLHQQIIYTPVRVMYKVVVELAPIWAMLFVFKPVQGIPKVDRQPLIVSVTDTTSTDGVLLDPSFLPPSSDFRSWRRRRRMVFNSGSGRTLLQDSLPFRGFVRIPRRRNSARRSASLPSSLRKTRSPPLATIPEEPGSSGHSSLSSSVIDVDETCTEVISNDPLSGACEVGKRGADVDFSRSM